MSRIILIKYPLHSFKKKWSFLNPLALAHLYKNGIAECKNDYILDITRTLLFHKNVAEHFWEVAILTAAHLISRHPTRLLDYRSPIDILTRFFPNFSTSRNLIPRIFGRMSADVRCDGDSGNSLEQRCEPSQTGFPPPEMSASLLRRCRPPPQHLLQKARMKLPLFSKTPPTEKLVPPPASSRPRLPCIIFHVHLNFNNSTTGHNMQNSSPT